MMYNRLYDTITESQIGRTGEVDFDRVVELMVENRMDTARLVQWVWITYSRGKMLKNNHHIGI